MAPSGHKAFLVQNTRDVELLLMHNNTYAAEYVEGKTPIQDKANRLSGLVMPYRRERESKSFPKPNSSVSRSRMQRQKLPANHDVDHEMVFAIRVFAHGCVVGDIQDDSTAHIPGWFGKLAHETLPMMEV